MKEKDNILLAKMIDDFSFFRSERIRNTTSNVIQLLSEYQISLDRIQKLNQKESVLFNCLNFFEIGETKHSFIIAKLLNPYAEHGQGNLFLKCFLEQLGIEVFKLDHWIVTAETGRVDIMLKRSHPRTIILIENKSNYAPDQDNQIYRYWHQQIYLPNSDLNISIEDATNKKNYQIIYLTPNEWKQPSENSLRKPTSFADSLPLEVPIEPKTWLFNRQLVQWLERSIELLPKDNHRLKQFVIQYIEFLNEKVK